MEESDLVEESGDGLEQQLFNACRVGDIEEVQQLLYNPQINIYWQNNKGQTFFFTACENGWIDIVRLLLKDERTKVNKAENLFAHTPFYAACWKGNVDVVRLLLKDERVDVNKECVFGTPFHTACYNGHVEIVKLLINDRRIDTNKENVNKRTPFYYACWEEQTDVVKFLLNHQRTIDINKVDGEGMTPFYVACRTGNIDIVKYILASRREVDLTVKDIYGNSAINIVKEKSEKPFGGFESEKTFENRRSRFKYIFELLESFERSPNETRFKLRKELDLAGTSIVIFFFFKKTNIFNSRW